MTSKKFSFDEFTRYQGVSRETFLRLQAFTDLLVKWQSTINLIGTATVNEIWTRHIIDSTQLTDYIQSSDSVVDLGSGAGFPGLILAILGVDNVTLIESDKRKVAFLREAARITKTSVTIEQNRVEDTDISKFSLITARGFAPLDALFGMLIGALKIGHKLLLLKGKTYKSEIEKARASWSFDTITNPSVTEKDGVILVIQNLKRKEAL